jgi:UDP-glucose 4-epimerase
MSRVLVTGGAGFIGSHLVRLLLAHNYDVTVLDNLSTGRREWVPQDAELVVGSVGERGLMRDLCEGRDGVFHLAAMSRVLPSLFGGPSACLFSAEQNVIGTLNVLISAAEAKVKRFVYSASSTYYGNLPAPHHEMLPPGCHTPYAISKYAGELYAMQFDRTYDLACVALRYFQVYGPRQPVSGEYAMVTGIFLDQAKRGVPLTIHGDGKQRRDFVHVADVAEANLRAFRSDVRGEVINVGTGHSHSIHELANLISGEQTFLPARAHDMRETRADTGKCWRLLGWSPMTEFEAGTRALMESDAA